MHEHTRFFKVSIALISFVLLFSMFASIVYDDAEEQDEMIIEEKNTVPMATGTRSPAQTTRSVLVELVTGTWCPPCQGGEGALDTLANEYPLTELSILEYHVSDPYAAPGNDVRQSYYGIGSVPTAVFDGLDQVVGGSSDPDSTAVYNNYKTKIDARLPIESQVTITMTGSLSGGTGSITANITAIDDIPPGLTNLKARFVVYEDHNYTVYVSGREYRLRYTAVEHLSEESISLSMYDNIEFTKTFSLDPSWDLELLGAVCFVQADSTKEVLQATSYNLSASSAKVDLAVTPHDISFSDPNPNENQMVTIYATIHNRGTMVTPTDVLVRFYDGDPSAGGTQIGSEQNIGVLSNGGSATAQVTWNTIGEAGDHEIVVVADYSDDITEPENENNNKAPKFINVIPGPPPGIDYIVIRSASNGGGINLCEAGNYPSYPVGYSTTYYAAAYNDSLGFVFDIDSIWMTGDDTIVDVTPSGVSSTITCSNTKDGTVTITVIDSTYGKTNTTDVTVIPPTVDYIQIRDAPGGGGNIITTRTYSALDTDTFYAAGYNNTAGYLNDVTVDWESDDPSIGDVSPATGTSTVFTAQQISLDDTCTVTATFGGVTNSTGLLTVYGPRIDDIRIRDTSGGLGNIVTTRTYIVLETDDFYAAAYNDSIGYLGDISVDWSSDMPSVGDVTPATGVMTTFSAQVIASDATCTVTATNGAVSNTTGLLTVLAPRIDEIMIRDEAAGAGNEVTTAMYVIWETDQFYATAYNDTLGYLYDVAADWDSDDTLVGDVSPTTGSTSTFFQAQDVAVDSFCTVTATYGIHSDSTGLLTVLASTIDEIKIRDAPGGAGTEVTSVTYSVLDTDEFYAAVYNDTTGYLGDINADWLCDFPTVGDVSPATGTMTTFTALQVASDSTCMVTATYGTISDSTGLLSILAPRIDEIKIRNAANDAGEIVTTVTYSVSDTDDFFAAAYNDTVDYLYDVNAAWSSSESLIGEVSPATGTSTTFTAQWVSADTTCIVYANYQGNSNSTGSLTILSPRIDYIKVRNAPDGAGIEVDSITYSVWDEDAYYAASYNDTVGFLYDVEAQWESDNASIGSVTSPGFFTNFTAQWIDSDYGCTITATYVGHVDTTGLLTVLSPRIDHIKVEDIAGGAGSEIDTGTYCVGESDVFHAAAYNNTVLYLYVVEADWEITAPSVGSIEPKGYSSTFTALQVPKTTTCMVNATYQSHKDSTGLLTVLAPTVNEIRIRNEAGGAGVEIASIAYGIGDTDEFYAAAYNDTVGFLFEVPAQWSSDAPDVGDVSPTTGGFITFTAQDVSEDSTCTVTATYSVFSDSTGIISVLNSTIDEIRIMDAPGGTGNVITSATFLAGEIVNFYAAGFNDTMGYLGDFLVTWTSDNTNVGSVDEAGNFSAQIVESDSVCIVTASRDGISGSTGLLLILAPTIDEIRIMDAEGGAGEEITIATYEAGDMDTFYAAAFNNTAGYLFDVPATWTIEPEAAGEVTSQGTSTIFTAVISRESGTCEISATYQGVIGSTGTLTVNALVDVTPPAIPGKPIFESGDADSIEITWTPNTEEDLDKYVVQRAEKPEGPFKDVATLDPQTTSYKDKRLDPGTTYYYRIFAYDDSGNPSQPSEVVEMKTQEPTGFFQEFLWLFIIIIIIVVVIIAAAMVARRGKKKTPVQAPQAQAAPKKKTAPPPPKKTTKPQAEKVAKTTKPETPPPPKEKKTDTPPPPTPQAEPKKDLPPPPPPPPED